MPSDGRKERGRLQVCALISVFCGGVVVGSHFSTSTRSAATPPVLSPWEERGPPTKSELGQAGWTLLHTIAANFPDAPTEQQQSRMDAFLHALGHLYPCGLCASHFRRYTKQHPVATSSRAALSMWMCGVHNEVNVRNGKESYYCDIGVLDSRWKDCGCGGNHSSFAPPSSAPSEEADGSGTTKRKHGPWRRRRLHTGEVVPTRAATPSHHPPLEDRSGSG